MMFGITLNEIRKGFNPITLITSTFRSFFNMFIPDKVKIPLKEIHWAMLLDELLDWSTKNPIVYSLAVNFVRPIVYFFFGDAIQK